MRRRIVPILLVALVGCSDDRPPTQADTTADAPDEVIMPLVTGNQWRYRQIHYDYTQPGLHGYGADTSEHFVRILGDTLIGGQRWYGVERGGGEKVGSSSPRYYRHGPDGLWSGFFDDTLFVANLLIKYPAAVGDEYELTYPGRETFTTRALIFAVDTAIVVGTDTFSCIGVMTTLAMTDQLTGIAFLAPGVGYIRNDLWVVTIGIPNQSFGYRPPDIRRELIAFEPGQ